MKKEQVIKFLKSKWGSCIITGLICITMGYGMSGVSDVEEELSKSKSTYEELSTKYNNQNIEMEQLTNKVNKSSKYLSLTDNERTLVDAKIDEVKQATADELARQKAEKEEADRKAQEEAAAKKAAEEEAARQAEANKYETGITWEDIARDNRTGEYCKFSGKVLQVMNGTGYTQYRVAIDSDYNRVLLLQINSGVSDKTILEDDIIFFKGKSNGNITYKTVLGAEKTIPAMTADEVTIQ